VKRHAPNKIQATPYLFLNERVYHGCIRQKKAGIGWPFVFDYRAACWPYLTNTKDFYKDFLPMPWIQTRDILNLSKDFYQQMQQIYTELVERSDQQRMEMLLAAIGRHVEFLSEVIRSMQKEVSSEVLDAWFQFSPDQPELDTDPTTRLGPEMKLDDVIFIIFDFDAALSEFYQRVADATPLEDVRRIFLNLKDSVEAEKKKLSVDISGLKQL
jgi:hypothetical protein